MLFIARLVIRVGDLMSFEKTTRMIDLEIIRSQIRANLPIQTRWYINSTPLNFDFSRSASALSSITARDIIGGSVEPEWTALRIFGESDYADGGGAQAGLSIHVETGEIFGLDVERHTVPMFLFNSNITSFIQTFLTLDRAFRLGTHSTGQLKELLTPLDPITFERSEWRFLCESIID